MHTTNQPIGDAVLLVDCTLRDGGYYNDWDFSGQVVQRYLRAVSRAKIPVVEIGFRLPVDDRFLGAAAYSTDEYLESIELPEGPTYGVMVNAKDLVASDDPQSVVNSLFDQAVNSPVDLVRIAANFGEIADLGPAVDRLHDLGYQVGVNLMRVSLLGRAELEEFGDRAAKFGVEVAYFADSFGSLRPRDVRPIVESIRDGYEGPIGCHLHDNMSFALANSLAAIDAGVTWVDGTVLGMGRGPGNARTEYLALELKRMGVTDVDDLPLLDSVTGDFDDLRSTYRWGSSIYYYLAALHEVHPSYIQAMTKDGRYSVEQIVGALDQLANGGGVSFDRGRMAGAVDRDELASGDGSWTASGWCADRDVLIVGPGPEGSSRRADIEHFIAAHRPVVIALNPIPPIDPRLVDRLAMCDPVRVTIDVDLLEGLGQPICLPLGSLKGVIPDTAGVDDFGMTVRNGVFEVGDRGCVVPRVEAAAYAIAIASAGGARRIMLTGFDGFEAQDPRQEQMIELFDLCGASGRVPEIIALTRTSYPVRQGSLYGRT